MSKSEQTKKLNIKWFMNLFKEINCFKKLKKKQDKKYFNTILMSNMQIISLFTVGKKLLNLLLL